MSSSLSDVVNQFSDNLRVFSYPSWTSSLCLLYKSCYVIRSGNDAADFTGLRLWPGAHLLSRYLIEVGDSGKLSDLSVIELGAGTGMCGMIAAHYAEQTIITDRVEEVLALIRRNIDINHLSSRATTMNLEWGRTVMNLQTQTVDRMIIGADIIYPDTDQKTINDLFCTVTSLLRQVRSESLSSAALPSPLSGCFMCAYINRSVSTTQRFFDAAVEHGYDCRIESECNAAKYRIEEEMESLTGYLLILKPRGDAPLLWYQQEPFVSMCKETPYTQKRQTELGANIEASALPFADSDAEEAVD